MVPPLVAMASVVAQVTGLLSIPSAFNWPRALPYLFGGLVGVPAGVFVLSLAAPEVLRASVGVFLVCYAAYQLWQRGMIKILVHSGPVRDGLVGGGGGFLGGFAGLSGPLPMIWLQIQGGSGAEQRAIYQPFNLLVLIFASFAMAVSGQIDAPTMKIALVCLPVTIAGAWIGARTYRKVSDRLFKQVVLGLLMVSGCILVAQSI